jgi:hypothetical protein
MEIVVLPATRTGRRFLGEIGKQRLVEKTWSAHHYIPLTA